MGKIQNLDFFYPSEEILFDLCLGDLKNLYDGNKDFKKEINRVAHRDLLVRNALELYSDMLFEYMRTWLARQDSLPRLKADVIKKYYEKLQYQLEVSKILKMFLYRESVENSNLSVTFTDVFDKIVIGDFHLKNQIHEVFLKEFKRLKLNETELSREEAIEEIKDCDDPEWLQEYAAGDCFDGNGVNPEFISEEIIENYIFVHYKSKEITLELVSKVITELEMSLNEDKGKVGAKIKNMAIGELAKRLSYIYIIQEFLKDKKDISIKVFPLSNKTCRFIYEYFDFWGLFYGLVKIDKSKQGNRASYIKSLIRNNENFSNRGIIEFVKGFKIIDPDLELRIDLFKKVKVGSISPEQFHETMSATRQ